MMRDDGLTAEERLRRTTARLRAEAAALPTSEAIEAGSTSEPAEPNDRPAEPEHVREEVPPAHWQEAAEDRSAEVRRPPREVTRSARGPDNLTKPDAQPCRAWTAPRLTRAHNPAISQDKGRLVALRGHQVLQLTLPVVGQLACR